MPAIINAGFDRKAHSVANGLGTFGPSLAVQSQKEEADINNIVRAFGVTGKLPQGVRIPSYGDFDSINDYRTAIEAVRSAEDSFAKLPATLRGKLNNDPQAFIEYALDPANKTELTELGLFDPPPHIKVGTVVDGKLVE